MQTKLSEHTHPRFIVWLKYFIFVSAFILFFDFLYTDIVVYFHSGSVISLILDIFVAILLCSIPFLTSAYFFGQNISVIDEGLLIEFLWKDLLVTWDKIIEIKPAFGFLRTSRTQKQICVVLTDALTPLHRFFGLIYGLSVKPAFIIYSTISEYDALLEIIKKHTRKS